MFTRILISLIGIGIGVLFVIYSYRLTRITGEFDWAIKLFGQGGMNTAYKVIGALLVLASLLYLFGIV